jgi:nicotinamide-nucleotide amidase
MNGSNAAAGATGAGATPGPATEEAVAELATELLRRARYVRRTIAVAESLTGGMVAAALTAVPGASAVFRGSVTAYATDVKASLLGVDTGLLDRVGAVHPDVAGQMAEGVRRLCGADLGLATTGVAGPEQQDGRAVGTVFTALASPGGVEPAGWSFGGDRDRIRLESTAAVLRTALLRLNMWTLR